MTVGLSGRHGPGLAEVPRESCIPRSGPIQSAARIQAPPAVLLLSTRHRTISQTQRLDPPDAAETNSESLVSCIIFLTLCARLTGFQQDPLRLHFYGLKCTYFI